MYTPNKLVYKGAMPGKCCSMCRNENADEVVYDLVRMSGDEHICQRCVDMCGAKMIEDSLLDARLFVRFKTRGSVSGEGA